MSDFKTKMEEYESKQKRSNRGIMSIIVAGLIIFAGLYLYNIQVKKEKRKDGAILLQQQVIEEQKKDSITYESKLKREDSIQKVLRGFQREMEQIKQVASGNNAVIQRIDSLKVKVGDIISETTEEIIVRYYRRIADGDAVEKAIYSAKRPNFYLHEKEVYNDDGSKSVNTLYYGSQVKREYVDILHKRLIANGIDIKELKPFISARGFEWKNKAMEIGFEKPTSKTDENARLFVRLYSYRPKEKVISQIENKLEAKGYQVKVFPQWKEKPSFFSNENTLLYYDKANVTKAESMANTLSKVTGLTFEVKMGLGYGVSRKEKSVLFIVHYNGN